MNNIDIRQKPYSYFQFDFALETQNVVDSFCDRQVTLLLSYLRFIMKDNASNAIFDYGCGENGALFFDLASQEEMITTFKIEYYAYDKCLYKIDKGSFDKYITNFYNADKQFMNVFLDNETLNANTIDTKRLRMNVIVLKNVMHEIHLSDFYALFSMIDDLLAIDGHLLIIDQIILKRHEPSNVAWHPEDIEKFISNFLGYQSLDNLKHKDILLEEYEDENTRVPIYAIGFIKRKNSRSIADFSRMMEEFVLESQQKRLEYIQSNLKSLSNHKTLMSIIYANDITQIKIQKNFLDTQYM